jgi:two-component sensor histidine kinase
MNPPAETKPVIEPSPEGMPGADASGPALRLRIRQQEILAELGVRALQGASFDELLNETARLTAKGLEAEFCKVMEYLPAEHQLLVRAGVGWDAGVIGVARVGVDLASPAGFALRTGKPVISNHLENEERFRTPDLLVKYGIRRAMNVILQGDGAPFGVLEVDARSEGDFSEQDIAFLQGAANILGMAIERQRHERNLKAAVERQQVLLKEINHRVKNSLQLVSSMLNLQASDGVDPEVRRELQEASNRVLTIARAHERLYNNDDVTVLDLGGYLRDVCGELNISASRCSVEVKAEDGICLSTDRAIPLALIATELVTNAAKYAYAGQEKGAVRVVLARQEGERISLSISDDGVGLPPDFDPQESKGLGMRIVRAFAAQLGAEFKAASRERGAEFVIVVPLNSPANNRLGASA